MMVMVMAKLIVVIVFIYGTRKSIAKCAGKIRHFMEKFEFWGILYLLGWPVGILICETVIPEYKHK